MTVYVPLGPDITDDLPSAPAYLVQSTSQAKLTDVVKAVVKAKRIVVVSGAGISVRAGIPDFRSSNGLFATLKRDNPKDGLTSGKDLFDTSVFNSEQTASLFYQMIARLSDMSLQAEPTPFHALLRAFDTRGQLLRLYTQNIDTLEEKAGISFGVPSFEERAGKSNSKRPRTESDAIDQGSVMKAESLPKCIPLHGTLKNMHCTLCSQTVPMAPYVAQLREGIAPPCPACQSLEATRRLIGKRLRGVGILRPSVVLYGEVHRQGEGVGEVVRRDLVGRGTGKGKGNKGSDLLIVVGTSLRVPGTKRIVREFSKSVKSTTSNPESQLPSPAPSPRRSPAQTDTPTPETEPIRTIFLNYDFPLPSREWENVFDVWVKGDAQEFAALVLEAMEERDKINLKKRKRAAEDPFTTPTKTPTKAKSKLKGETLEINTQLLTPPKSVKKKLKEPITPSKKSPTRKGPQTWKHGESYPQYWPVTPTKPRPPPRARLAQSTTISTTFPISDIRQTRSRSESEEASASTSTSTITSPMEWTTSPNSSSADEQMMPILPSPPSSRSPSPTPQRVQYIPSFSSMQISAQTQTHAPIVSGKTRIRDLLNPDNMSVDR